MSREVLLPVEIPKGFVALHHAALQLAELWRVVGNTGSDQTPAFATQLLPRNPLLLVFDTHCLHYALARMTLLIRADGLQGGDVLRLVIDQLQPVFLRVGLREDLVL